MHLLRWQFQPNLHSRSWQLTIKEQRLRLAQHLSESPSLKPFLSEYVDGVYPLAVIAAQRETGLDEFLDGCPYTAAQVLDMAFLPEG
jgi:hypothetical protein